jgi:hypothetical protein
MPPQFWVEALQTAVHTLNLLPLPSLGHYSPFELLFHKPPTYDHLRVFGSACYPNLTSTTPNKLSPRSTLCVFLGYPLNYKGYRCLDLRTHKVIISRHVTFDETFFPYSTHSSKSYLLPLSSSSSFQLPTESLTTQFRPLLNTLQHPSAAATYSNLGSSSHSSPTAPNVTSPPVQHLPLPSPTPSHVVPPVAPLVPVSVQPRHPKKIVCAFPFCPYIIGLRLLIESYQFSQRITLQPIILVIG